MFCFTLRRNSPGILKHVHVRVIARYIVAANFPRNFVFLAADFSRNFHFFAAEFLILQRRKTRTLLIWYAKLSSFTFTQCCCAAILISSILFSETWQLWRALRYSDVSEEVQREAKCTYDGKLQIGPGL